MTSHESSARRQFKVLLVLDTSPRYRADKASRNVDEGPSNVSSYYLKAVAA